jgi:hypothetical protein
MRERRDGGSKVVWGGLGSRSLVGRGGVEMRIDDRRRRR